jgi:hypothetical protein
MKVRFASARRTLSKLSVATLLLNIGLSSLVATLPVFSIPAFAAISVTPATGGSAIYSNRATDSDNTWTALVGPIISESAVGEITAGNPTSKTIVLNAPTGFDFEVATVTATVTTVSGNCNGNGNATLKLGTSGGGS